MINAITFRENSKVSFKWQDPNSTEPIMHLCEVCTLSQSVHMQTRFYSFASTTHYAEKMLCLDFKCHCNTPRLSMNKNGNMLNC